MKVGETIMEMKSCIDSSGFLLTGKAIESGVSKDNLYRFIRENNFEKLASGIYLEPNSWGDDSYVLHLRCPQAIFSHDEALYYHDLIDREPLQPTVTIYSGYNPRNLTRAGAKVYTVKKELLLVGRITIKNALEHELPYYNLERTICDLIRSRSQFELQDFQTALHRYAARQDKDLNQLMHYARLFRVEKLVRSYMEVIII